MYEPPTSPQLIGGVLDGAVKLFKTSFTQTIGLAVVAGVGGSLWRLFDNSLERTLSMMDGTFDPAVEITRLRICLRCLSVSWSASISISAFWRGWMP